MESLEAFNNAPLKSMPKSSVCGSHTIYGTDGMMINGATITGGLNAELWETDYWSGEDIRKFTNYLGFRDYSLFNGIATVENYRKTSDLVYTSTEEIVFKYNSSGGGYHTRYYIDYTITCTISNRRWLTIECDYTLPAPFEDDGGQMIRLRMSKSDWWWDSDAGGELLITYK